MEPFKSRGYMLTTTLKYLREGLPADRSAAALALVKPETLRLVETAKAAEWYPAEYQVDMYNAVIEAAKRDPVLAEEDLVNVGRFGANEAINSFLKLLMKVLTPTLFAKKLPSLYERDNSKGKVTVEVEDDRFVCHIDDCKGCAHLAPVSVGWSSFALGAMGKKLSRRTIHGWSLDDPDSGKIRFELHWEV
jgi:hypothetical protein